MTKSSTKVLCLLALFSVAVLASDVPDLNLTPVQAYDCTTVQALAKSVANDKTKLNDVLTNTIPAARDVIVQCKALVQKSYDLYRGAVNNERFLQVNSGSSAASDIAVATNKIQQQTAALQDNEFTKAFNQKVSSLLDMTNSMKGSDADIESLYQQILAAFDGLDAFLDKCVTSYTNSLNNDINPRITEYANYIDYCKNTVTILGASYGDAGFKSKVQGFADNAKGDEIKFSCSNEVFGDPWKGIVKTCVVYYQVGDGQPAVTIVKEGKTVSIKKSEYTSSGPLEVDETGIQVIGCTYGLADKTKKCKSLVSSNGKKLSFKAENDVFTDTWDGTKKSLIIVYRVNGGDIQQSVVQEGDSISISA